MNIVVISHAADLDGISSAAIIMRKYGVHSGNVVFVDYDRQSMLRGEKLFQKLFKKGSTLFIADLGAESSTDIFTRIVKYAKRKNGHVLWFDHHVWSKANVKNIAGMCDAAVVGENKCFCASEITARELGMNDKYITSLLKIVHAADFALKPKNSNMKRVIKSYALGLSYFRMKGNSVFLENIVRIAESISLGKPLPEFLYNASSKFDNMNKQRLKKMITTVVKGGVISVGFTPVVSTNDACALIIKKTGSDIGCYVNTDSGKVHLRSIKADCSLLAKHFGGGGHPHASGYDLKRGKYNLKKPADRMKVVLEIIAAAKELYG